MQHCDTDLPSKEFVSVSERTLYKIARMRNFLKTSFTEVKLAYTETYAG